MIRQILILLLLAGSLAACAPNLSSAPARPGVVKQRGASGNVQTIQFVVLPNDATCQLSGTAYRQGMRGSGLLSVPIKASPVTLYCTKDGHVPFKRSFTGTLEESGRLATEAVVNVFFGFFKSVMIGKDQRYPPMVHVVLSSLKDSLNNRQQLSYNR